MIRRSRFAKRPKLATVPTFLAMPGRVLYCPGCGITQGKKTDLLIGRLALKPVALLCPTCHWTIELKPDHIVAVYLDKLGRAGLKFSPARLREVITLGLDAADTSRTLDELVKIQRQEQLDPVPDES